MSYTPRLREVEINIAGVEELERKLGNLKSKAPQVLSRAINRAAEKARTETKREAAARYFVSQGNVLKTITLSKASTAKLSAEMKSKGSQIALSKFKVSPKRGVKRTSKGGYSPSVYKVAVKKEGGMKTLHVDPKSFIATMKSGHVGVMRRDGSERMPITQLYGPAVPSMIKNEEVIGRIKEAAADMLERRIDAEVNNILQRGR